jgi:hypothetical protein
MMSGSSRLDVAKQTQMLTGATRGRSSLTQADYRIDHAQRYSSTCTVHLNLPKMLPDRQLIKIVLALDSACSFRVGTTFHAVIKHAALQYCRILFQS